MNKRGFIHLYHSTCYRCHQRIDNQQLIETEDDNGHVERFHKQCWLDYMEDTA